MIRKYLKEGRELCFATICKVEGLNLYSTCY